MKFIFFLLSFFFMFQLLGQPGWTWSELDTMPTAISNNAVSQGINTNGDTLVYSFAGIDSSKKYNGISLQSFAYNYSNATWTTLPNLPDTMGKIAAAASTIKNKIYIVGGYHVKANGNEVSSNKVHVFDPETNSFLPDAADIPKAIDDQVQCVWRDSLLFVITGWSNTSNVTNVQIYNPVSNSWTSGTSTPNQSNYKMFGASGVIIGDTIYYNGGSTSGFSFNSVPYLRKGIIDPNDPTTITWSQEENNPGAAGYRMAAASYQDRCFWIGGSGKAYNYNGIAYDGSGGVEPLQRILRYESGFQQWDEGLGAPHGVMDLRGIARIAPTKWIICGGMELGQVVSNKTYLLEYDPIIGGFAELNTLHFDLYPNPAKDILTLSHVATNNYYTIFSIQGETIKKGIVSSATISIAELAPGPYIMVLESEQGRVGKRFVKN